MNAIRRARRGFTLIEILIVVMILGILAAIVIPQFTNASKEARQASLVSVVQSLRSQVALYKLQHNDNLPGFVSTGAAAFVSGEPAVAGDPPTADSFWAQMTLFSDVTGKTKASSDAANGFIYGPYMQSVAVNSLTNNSTVKDGAAATAGADFVYDFAGNTGSGKVWGTSDRAAGTLVQQ
jgi:general secretion pathway protein G